MMKTIIKLTTIVCLIITLFSCNKDDDDMQEKLAIGSYHQGGIVFYLDETGEHGLVCATKDQNESIRWGYNDVLIGDTQETLGSGLDNTLAIASAYPGIENASQFCLDLDLGGYQDWFLPSKSALYVMYQNREKINTTALANGGEIFKTTAEEANYWSSSENSEVRAWLVQFDTG